MIGGGIPIGSILLIEEDQFGRYAECLSKYFLAEGVVHKHALFVGALDDDPRDLVSISFPFEYSISFVIGLIICFIVGKKIASANSRRSQGPTSSASIRTI